VAGCLPRAEQQERIERGVGVILAGVSAPIGFSPGMKMRRKKRGKKEKNKSK
jgi:hypothetical protein